MVGCLPVSVWTGSDFGVCSPIRSTGSGGCVVGGLMVGAGPAGGLLEFSGFWCGGWLVSACWLALVWTGSVFGSRSRVWSVVWVLRVDGRAVLDCRVIGWPLEFRGFWCGEWLVVVCRPVPVWARSVFGARSLVWSVVWVLRADGLAVVDCRSVRDSLGSSGFVVLSRQTDQCRPVLVWTGSDSVL